PPAPLRIRERQRSDRRASAAALPAGGASARSLAPLRGTRRPLPLAEHRHCGFLDELRSRLATRTNDRRFPPCPVHSFRYRDLNATPPNTPSPPHSFGLPKLLILSLAEPHPELVEDSS